MRRQKKLRRKNPAQEESSEDGQTVEDPSATESEQTFDSEAETEQPEQTFEETTPMPETSFEAYSNKVFVKVYAPEGAFPEGTTMKLTPVASEEVMDAVENAVEGTVEKVHAVDITFYNVDGTPIEPQTAINVSMSAYGITDDDAVVVHVPDEGEAEVIDECIVEKDGVTFESDQFSIYAIVETGVDARLSVVFHRADGTETTQMINERQIPQIDQYIFDPGANEPEGSIFKGWTTNENYDSSTEALTVAQVREAVAAKLQEGVSDGDTLDFYAMAFNAYEVTYLDEKGILVQAYQVLVRTDAADQTVEHDVTLNYTPYPTDEEGVSAEFIGWQQLSPEVTGEMVLYKPGDSFTFAEGVKAYTLKAYTQKGHWLSFDENLSGASYTEPQFIAIGAKPVTPSNPTRVGYTFDGWYTEDASSERDGQVAGETFNFNNELTKNTTVYAKWNKATTASYSVVIWKQNVDGEHYDYGETVTVNNATVDNNTYAVTANGSGVRINTGSGNTNKSYQFFHLRESNGIDAAKPVAAEGNTVINVYFDRDTITYNFRYSNSNTQTFSGLYGSAFTQWPDPGNGYVWHRSSGYGYYATHISFPLPLTEFNPTAAAITDSEQNNTEFTFTLADYDQGYTLRVYKQTTSGTWSYTTSDLIATAPLSDSGRWYPTETYTGFTLNAYCTGTASASSSWTSITPSGHIDYRSNFNLRYSRNQYDIIYSDGIFVDGSGNPVDAVKREEIPGLKETGVYYESDLSSKNKTPEYDGFVFLGWYDNEGCVGEPYPFTTMPAHNVTLYAKWGLNEFEINLHGNDSTEDPIQYTSDTQAEQFWMNTGEKIGNVGGERIYYDLVGWYTDPEFKHAFDFDAIVVNKTNVQKYGEIYSAEKIDPSYPTVIGKLDLYAKWRGKLVGSDGIVIEYVDGEHGTGATEKDENKYVDGSFANARGAFAAADPETYVFSHWEVQTWNGSAYEDAGIKVFPGETFEVKSTDAKIVGEDGKVYTLEEAAKIFKENKNAKFSYTVQVKAVYIEKDKELETYIKWYYNYEGAPSDGLYQQSNGLKINQGCDVPEAPTRKGYTFLGWIRGVEETEASTTSADHVTSLETPYINYKDGAYDVTKVAPDEMLVNDNAEIGTGEAYKYHHAMYAKWEENEVTIKYAVASDSTDMGTVAPAEETLKAATGTAAGSTATARSDMYIIDYWTVDDGTEHVGDAATFVPSKNSDGLYEEHTYYAHFKLNKAEVTVHHYLKGTTTKVAEDVTSNEVISSEYTAAAATEFLEAYTGKTLTAESYSPSQKITVEAEGNEIIVYYTLPLTITAKTDSKTYDGQPLNGEYTITGALKDDEAAIEKALGTAPSITDVGTKDYLTEEEQSKITVPAYYAVTYTPGKLEVTKRTVTLTSATDSKVYDGQPLTNNEVTVGGDGFAEGEGAEYDVTGTQTEVGDSKNTFTYTLNEGTKAENYEITTEEGTLTVTELTDKVTVTITEHSGSEKYDGTEKTVTGYDVEISNPLYTDKDFTFSGKAEVKGTDAGTYEMQLKPEDFTNTNKNFSNVEFVIVDGTLEITKRPVILTSQDATKVYDGTALTNKEVKADGFVDGEGATYDVTGSQTDVGESANTFSYTLKEGTKADNYDIKTVEGTLKVTPVTDQVTVTITENSGSEKYDGSEKTVTGYTVSIDNELYTENDFEFNGDATVKGTDAGTYEMELKAEDFNNISDNFSNVEFVIVDGTLEISKRTVTLTSADDEKVYDGTELTNDEITVGGDGFAEGEGATYDVTGTQTDAGNSTNTFEYTLNEGTKADNYEITKTEGTLTVTPVTDEVVVTITGNKDEVTYNGKEQSVEGYTVEISNDLYKEADFAFSGNDKVSAKNANDEPYMMGLKEADFENTSKNFTNVTFKVTDGQLKINKLKITIETGSAEKAYDGEALVKYDDLKVTVTEDEKYEGTDPEKNEYSFTLSTGDKLTVTITGTQTYVGSSDNTCDYAFEAGKEPAAEPGYKKSALLKNAAVKLNDAKEAVNEGAVDNNYDVTVNPGTLTVTDDVDPSDVVKKTHEGEDIKFNTGDVVTFTITATNIYDEDKDITLEELEGVELAKSEFKGVKPGETVTTTATYTITEADVLAGSFKNTVTAKFNGIDKPYPGEDEVPTEEPKPSIHVNKTTSSTPADGKAYKLGETIEYTINVANDGNVTLTDIVATDELTGDEWKIETLAPGESKEFTAKHVVTEEDVRNGKVVNVATATGKGPTDKDPDVIPGTSEDPTEESKSHITIEKTITNKPANGKAYRDGETIEYKIVATNDGNQTMKDITVKDELTGDEWKIETLAPGESKEFTAKYTVTKDDAKKGSVVNTATGEGTSENPDDKPEVTPGTVEAKTETTPDPTPVPKTGDKTSMGLWVSMMAAALAGFGGTLIKRKKEEA